MNRILPVFFAILFLTACNPTVAVRGNLIDNDDLATIEIGTSNKADIRNVLGSPTTTAPLDNNVWYYIGQRTERFGWREPKVTERRTLTLLFDQDGILASMKTEDNQGRVVAMVDDTTQTSGKELTALQQFFGNLGRFNTDNRNATFDPTGGVR